MREKFSIESGWLIPAEQCPSPNFNQRPEQGGEVSLLVIHNISLPPQQFGGGYIESFFQNRLDAAQHPYFETIAAMKVSAHLLIARDGRCIQFVNFDHRAWHAGQSSYEGRENCNDFSIGIELEGCDQIPFTELQYQQLVAVTKALLSYYPQLHKEAIVGHSDIAPGRKTDPGPYFDWCFYRSML